MRFDLVSRQAAVTATMAKFATVQWGWDQNATCAHMVRYHLTRCGRQVDVRGTRVHGVPRQAVGAHLGRASGGARHDRGS